MSPSLSQIRNVGIMAHIDAGKTTVTERILFYAGRIHRTGEVHDGETVMDWMEEERKRGITITSAVTQFDWGGAQVHLIDTPGHVDFTVEVERSLRVLDGVVALYDGVSGVEPQSETVWFQAQRYRVPRLGFVNKMDRPGASFLRSVEDVRDRLKAHAIPIQIPIGEAHTFEGVIDLVHECAIYFHEADDGMHPDQRPIPEALREAAAQARENMIMLLADVDDDIAESYLEGAPIEIEMLQAAMRRATITHRAVPFLCGSGLKDKGIQPLLDAIVAYLPSPIDLPPIQGVGLDGQPQERALTVRDPLSALVYKVQIIDNQKLVFVRIYSGVLEDGARILNATKNVPLRVKNIYRMHAQRREERIARASAGDLVALPGARNAQTGDTLCDPNAPIILESIEARKPVIAVTIEPERQRDRDKLFEVLGKISEEDPTLRIEEDKESGELLMHGMGELHLEVVCNRIKSEFGVEVRPGVPHVVCRETVTSSAMARGEFFRETDDDRVFGDVTVHVAPRERGAGNSWSVELPDTHPRVRKDVLKEVEHGAADSFTAGPILGAAIEDTLIRVIAIGEDPARDTNTKVVGYRIAVSQAVRQALEAAQPRLLEPLMKVEIMVPDEHLGEVIGDVAARSGSIEEVEDRELRKTIRAIVPLREMFGYTTRLRSMTQGRGTFNMVFHNYDLSAS